MQSTKTIQSGAGYLSSQKELTDANDDYFPSSPLSKKKTNHTCYAIISTKDVTTGYMDLSGRFQKKSSRGNEYLMVGHNYDANYIMGVPLRNRKGATIGEFWQHIHDTFKRSGVAPEAYVLDN